MESYQDAAVNTLHVLDDTRADDCKGGSAIFEGGINVVKNIKACEVDVNLCRAIKGKISDSLSVQHNIYTDGAILPLTTCSLAQLGTPVCKWNTIDVVSTNSQELCSVNAILRNSFLNNVYYNINIINIVDNVTSTATYDLDLDVAITIVNITSTYDDDRSVILHIPCAPTGTNHDYKRIIFNQNKSIPIKWSYNIDDFTIIADENQILDFINVNGIWTLINYNKVSVNDIHTNTLDISNMNIKQNNFDASLSTIATELQALIDYNVFLTASDTSANSFLDYIDETSEIKADITTINTSLSSMTTTISNLNSSVTTFNSDLASYKTSNNNAVRDVSLCLAITNNTVDVFKSISNQTFQSINSNFLMYDTRMSGMSLKLSSMELDVKKSQEFVDILDKRLCDHIANSDNKYKFLNDKMTHINEKINLIMARLNMC